MNNVETLFGTDSYGNTYDGETEPVQINDIDWVKWCVSRTPEECEDCRGCDYDR